MQQRSPSLHNVMNYILLSEFFGLADQGKDIVFRFIIQYRSLRGFGPWVIIIGLFLYEDF
jgi:hypothetical protein